MHKRLKGCLLLGAVLLSGGAAQADDSHMRDHDRDRMQEMMEDRGHDNDRDRDRMQDRDRVYGWELMSAEERNEYRHKMRSLKSDKERDAYRMEHHKLMQERAKQMGIDLGDMPMEGGHMMR